MYFIITVVFYSIFLALYFSFLLKRQEIKKQEKNCSNTVIDFCRPLKIDKDKIDNDKIDNDNESARTGKNRQDPL